MSSVRLSGIASLRRLSLSLVLTAVALLVAVSGGAQIIGDPDDPPLPPFCPSRVSSGVPVATVLVNIGNNLPYRRVGNQYEVFFTLNTPYVYNPDGACNLGDDIIVRGSSINIAGSFTTIPAGANPFVQRSMFITPQQSSIGVFLCFKLKFHGPDYLDQALKNIGRVILPPLDSVPNDGVLRTVNSPLGDGCGS